MKDSRNVVVIGSINPVETGFAITLDSEYKEGLIGLRGFSHAVVLWWASDADSDELRAQLIYEKPYAMNPNDVGVFGSRSPSRPNPIGMSVIALENVDIENAVITTPYIDTSPGTPVIDLKPYFAASDRVRDVVSPAWCDHWPSYYEDSAGFDWTNEFE